MTEEKKQTRANMNGGGSIKGTETKREMKEWKACEKTKLRAA